MLLGHGPLLGGRAYAETGYYNQPRFFPVPARPVFLPRPEGEPVPGGEWYPGDGASPPLPPTLSEPELVPTPSVAPRQKETMLQTDQDTQAQAPASWVFRPAAGETSVPDIAPLIRLGSRREGDRR